MTKRQLPEEPRIIGTHEGCGGEVIYIATPTMGIRKCLKCKKDSMHGSVNLDSEMPR